MKTIMLAIALERGRVFERRVQACGFVSRTITRSEGGGPMELTDQLSALAERNVYLCYLQLRAHNDQSHLPRSWLFALNESQASRPLRFLGYSFCYDEIKGPNLPSTLFSSYSQVI